MSKVLEKEIDEVVSGNRGEDIEKRETCLHRFLGECENCKRDYGNEYPNNLDCPNYYEIAVRYFNAG